MKDKKMKNISVWLHCKIILEYYLKEIFAYAELNTYINAY
jgi:hypothetical protein